MNKKKQAVPQDELSFTASNATPEPHLNDMIQRLLEHESAFRVFLHRRVGDEAVAEDLLQQSMIRAVQRHHSVRNDDSVVAWFYKIIRHTLIDYYRSKSAEARRNEAFLQELTLSGDDKEPPIDEMKTTVCTCLHRLLPKLRSNYAELIRRIDLEDESPKRVAEELKISQSNLTVRLHRARQALRASLEQSCGVCSTHGCLNCTCD
ncbi:sigma-70 family RNA polymerase sigma factor [Nitrospira lenta]|uniref:RNA polymerase sigma-70 factor, ECF subfamily n=1 Tax=Nitrospira lenta TaxID=1436998 RepID=A0A330L9E0_9BACT|nr:sigma-70 family RNA polymerase sigma factor [Nitrospira lenta]SPP66315.1 RNA polymerase sigma-70 factor, ECF subfamily [Nitrospira lenta]